MFSRLEVRLWWGRVRLHSEGHSASALAPLIHMPSQEHRPHLGARPWLSSKAQFLPGPSCFLEREGSDRPEVRRRGSEGSGNCLSTANLLI